MKTLRNFFTWVLLAMAGNALAAELSVADFSIMPGQQQEVEVALNNADYECIMLDFWMSLPEGVTIAKDEDGELMYEESSARFRKSHSMEVTEKEGNIYRILIFSTKNETLKGTSGTLFTLTLEAAANAPQGQQQGRFYNQIFSDADRQEHNPADVSFYITVGSNDELVTPPAGLQTETYYITGDHNRYISSTSSWSMRIMAGDLKIGYDGNTVYMEAPSPFVESLKWVKGTKSGNTIIFPSGQYLGKVQGNDLYFVGYDGENIVDVVLNYDSENDEYWLSDNIFILDNSNKFNYDATGYWVKLLLSKTYKTIDMQTAGTLSSQISNDEKYKLKGLRLYGKINGTDLRLLRDMAGNNYLGDKTEGQLARLDMVYTQIVKGGEKYLDSDHLLNFGGNYHYSIEEDNIIPEWAFCFCESLRHVAMPEELTSIGERAFYGCNLESITIPKNVKSIGKYAFYDNKNLSSVVSLITVPFDVDKSAFSYYYSCTSTGVIFGDTDVFTNASLTVPYGTMEAYKSKEGWKLFSTIIEQELQVGDIITSKSSEGITIAYSVIDPVAKTCSVGLGYHIAAIDTNTSGKVTIPATVNGFSVVATSMGAFENCKLITEVDVPEGVEELGGMTFYNCESLEKVSLPSTLKRMRGVTFGYCRSLVSVDLPESFESFYNGEFAVCSSLKSIHIPDHVTEIPDQNFNNCNNLVSVNFPTQLKSIGSFAFFNCNGLQSLILPDLLETIGEYAFDWCDNVKTVTIPQSITSIGDYAFCVCTKLEKVRVKTPTPISINKEVFCVNQTDFTTATLYVPKGSKQQYKEAEGWKLFSNIVEFDPDATTVEGTTIGPKDRNVYSVDGRKQHEVSHGLNIVRMSDGTVRKVVKK